MLTKEQESKKVTLRNANILITLHIHKSTNQRRVDCERTTCQSAQFFTVCVLQTTQKKSLDLNS
jgi:hypothetical protein